MNLRNIYTILIACIIFSSRETAGMENKKQEAITKVLMENQEYFLPSNQFEKIKRLKIYKKDFKELLEQTKTTWNTLTPESKKIAFKYFQKWEAQAQNKDVTLMGSVAYYFYLNLVAHLVFVVTGHTHFSNFDYYLFLGCLNFAIIMHMKYVTGDVMPLNELLVKGFDAIISVGTPQGIIQALLNSKKLAKHRLIAQNWKQLADHFEKDSNEQQ